MVPNEHRTPPPHLNHWPSDQEKALQIRWRSGVRIEHTRDGPTAPHRF